MYIQFYICGWTSITLPPRKKHRKYETKIDVKPKFWLYQKVTSAELEGLIHFMRSKLYTCVFPQKMQNLSISQSGSWHILNRMKWDPSRIPVYSDRDPAPQPGILAESSGIPIGIRVYFAGIYSGFRHIPVGSQYILTGIYIGVPLLSRESRNFIPVESSGRNPNGIPARIPVGSWIHFLLGCLLKTCSKGSQ